MMKFDSMIFDLDGTLWDSSEGIVNAWKMVFERHPEIDRTPVTAQELASCFGLPLEEIAARIFPEYSPQKRSSLMDECSECENIYLAEHGGMLFPGEIEVLKELSAKLPLAVVSNCQVGYIESFFTGNHTGRYFMDHECMGATKLDKGQNIKLVVSRNGFQAPMYAGDTQGDCDAAREAGVPFVYASYGFGEVDGCDYRLESIRDLLKLLDE